jgi:hypothetical protein
MVTRFAVVRLNAHDMSQETVAAFGFDPTAPLYAPLDTPNSLAFGQGKCGHKNLFVTNLGLIAGPWPGRGLVKIETKAPGLPLP